MNLRSLFNIFRGWSGEMRGPIDPLQTREAEPEPIGVRPLTSRRHTGPGIDKISARLAIDLGTSASAVACVIHEGDEPRLANFGRLGQVEPDLPDTPLIGSEVLRVELPERPDRPGDLTDGSICWFLGSTAIALREQFIAEGLSGHTHFYSSVKRLLDVCGREAQIEMTLKSVFTELLLLALAPARSATLRARQLLDRRAAPPAGATAENPLTALAMAMKETGAAPARLGFHPDVRRELEQQMRSGGLEIHLTVPNSYSAREIDILMKAARAATIHLNLGLTPNQVTVSILREAEAIAWWEYRCAVATTARGERWLVFDMGAGTTDLALLEVSPGYIGLLSRSGVPIGGDDIDLLFIRHLGNPRLRRYFEESTPGGRAREQRAAELSNRIAALRKLIESEKAVRDSSEADQATGGDLLDHLSEQEFLEELSHLSRVYCKQVAQECKLIWSRHMATEQRFEVGRWLEETFAGRGNPQTLEDFTQEGMFLSWHDQVRLFTYLVTQGCCLDLVEQAERNTQPVRRVILSGRAVRMPGIPEALAYALEGLGLADRDTVYQQPRAGRSAGSESLPRDGKLAVVRGAAVFAVGGWRNNAPGRLGNEVTMWVNDGSRIPPKVVFSQRTPLDVLGLCRKVVRLPAHLPPMTQAYIYRHRISRRIVEELSRGDAGHRPVPHLATSIMARKRLLAFKLREPGIDRIGLLLDELKGGIEIYSPGLEGDLRRTAATTTEPWLPDPHPITLLPENWQWTGEGAPPVGGAYDAAF